MAYSKSKAKKIFKVVKEVGVDLAAARFGITPDSVRRAVRIAGGEKRMVEQSIIKSAKQYVQGLSFDEPTVVEQDNRPICIHPDVHAPYNHPDAIEFFRWVQDWRGCQERVVNVGDLADFHSMSRFNSETDALNATVEYERFLEFADEYSKAFPVGDMVLGNHDTIPQRQMKELGLLTSILKVDNELYGLPDTWNIHPLYHVIDPDGWNILVEHGIGSSGKYGCANTAKEKRCSYVQGHTHSAAAVIYSTNHESTIFGMNVGCCVDSSSLAMRYGKYGTRKGVLACGVVYGGSHAEVITMETWKNYKRWF